MSPVKRPTSGRGSVLLAAAAIVAVAALAAGLWLALRSGDGGSEGRRASADPSEYFIGRSELLLKPSQELAQALDMGIISWEEPTAASEDPSLRFSVQLRNNHPSRAIAVADLIVVPGAGTAPEARLRKEEFVQALVRPGTEEIVDVVAEPVAGEPRGEEERFGLHLYAVAAFTDDVPAGWRELPTPADEEAFGDAWGRFAWLEEFMEVSPEILTIRP